MAFAVLLPSLWLSGLWLFLRSGLPPARKIVWSLLLVAVGAVIGLLLPLPGIRDRFFVLIAALPLLAWIDIRLARSNRTFLFWFRACAFEVCTVFAAAAVVRLVTDGL